MNLSNVDIRELLFNYRGYTPIPLAAAVIILADPTWVSYLAGLGIALIGEGIRLWGVSHAGGATRTTAGVGGEVLITSGPFAYVRNPLYLGNFILSLGLCIMAWAWMPWMLLIYGALFALQYGFIISLEEECLRGKFGAVYENYAGHVPRFFPRFTPYQKWVLTPTCLKKTLRTERNTLQSFALFSLAILIRWKVF